MAILTTILFWLAIWFNVGLLAQVIMTIFDGIVNHRWPFHWKDSTHFFMAGVFGFLSALNATVFLIRFAIEPEAFVTEEEDDVETVYFEGLTDEEIEQVGKFVENLVASRPKEEPKSGGEETG